MIHRFGELEPNDQIVLVAVASAHRGDAFAACEFIMDYLKTQAPFWKKEHRGARRHLGGGARRATTRRPSAGRSKPFGLDAGRPQARAGPPGRLLMPRTMQSHASTTFSDLLQEVQRFWTPLPDKPEETPEGLLRGALDTACGTPLSVDRAYGRPLPALDDAARLACASSSSAGRPACRSRTSPSGRRFLGLEFLAGPDALIPRKETEILGRAALAKIACMAKKRGPLMVIDVCTGSGNLALAYAYYEPQARVHASDLSPEAVRLARKNCEFMGLERARGGADRRSPRAVREPGVPRASATS